MLRLIGASIFVAILAHMFGFVALSEVAISLATILVLAGLILGIFIVIFD